MPSNAADPEQPVDESFRQIAEALREQPVAAPRRAQGLLARLSELFARLYKPTSSVGPLAEFRGGPTETRGYQQLPDDTLPASTDVRTVRAGVEDALDVYKRQTDLLDVYVEAYRLITQRLFRRTATSEYAEAAEVYDRWVDLTDDFLDPSVFSGTA